MFIVVALILGLAWVLGFTVFKVASVGFHMLIVLAAVSLVLHIVRGRSVT